MHSSINIIAAVGLALGGVLGLVGAMVTQQNVQAILWAIDGAGLVMATPLLAIKYFRTGNDIVAGGFLVSIMHASKDLVMPDTKALHNEDDGPMAWLRSG